MPKKKHNYLKSFKSPPTTPPSSSPSSQTHSSAANRSARKSVNEILSNLRGTSLSGQGISKSHDLEQQAAFILPSVPPAIREILQIPETPAPLPRRPLRQRFDSRGRRLPPGPPPPQSWTTTRADGVTRDGGDGSASFARHTTPLAAATSLPGIYLPAPGSLVDIVLRRIALGWRFHRIYDQYHLYFLPNHLKPALMRYIGLASDEGVTAGDLRTILLPPAGTFDDEDLPAEVASTSTTITHLDLSGSVGRSVGLKDIAELLFPQTDSLETEPLQDSWDAADSSSSPPLQKPVLLPNLTHLSLALDDHRSPPPSVSWRRLLTLSSKLSSITHLSLACWPDPCLTPRARYMSVTSPQGRDVPYAGTHYYSHSIDHDWSEALLVLRMLSTRLYKLEFLDLTGCVPWFKALIANEGHDYVDWAGSWGKITRLRLHAGVAPGDNSMPSEKLAYRESVEMAGTVEKHIVAMRAGKGRFIVVERDKLDP